MGDYEVGQVVKMGRILGLDIGHVRIGVAISDEEGRIASPLRVILREGRELEEIKRIVQEFGVDKIVVGYPVKLDGREGRASEEVKKFVHALADKVTCELQLWDERFTTVEAERVLLEADVPRKARKGLRDKIAAAIMLQSYLERMRGGMEEDERVG